MTDNDDSLLQAFASTRDEKAFRALADRYLGLVFHTAMRHTHHRQIAEDISQNILVCPGEKGILAGQESRAASGMAAPRHSL